VGHAAMESAGKAVRRWCRRGNRLQAGLGALVEQPIGQLANAWTLRRWRGLLCRVRDVYRAPAARICLGRWIHRIPT
jgi:hypothetical protein